MQAFFQTFHTFPIWNAVRSELSWTQYGLLTKLESEDARQWYVNEAAAHNWSTCALERQLGSLYDALLLLSQDKDAVALEAGQRLAELEQCTRAFVRDPVMLEFLGLRGAGKLLESSLEQGLIDELEALLLKLVKGFAFVGHQ